MSLPNAYRAAIKLLIAFALGLVSTVMSGGILNSHEIVEAQTVASPSTSERDLMAQLIRAEGEAEPYSGKVAIADVVLNRVDSTSFPDTIAEVIYQPRQFEPVDNGRLYLPARAEDYRALDDALTGWDPSGGAVYF